VREGGGQSFVDRRWAHGDVEGGHDRTSVPEIGGKEARKSHARRFLGKNSYPHESHQSVLSSSVGTVNACGKARPQRAIFPLFLSSSSSSSSGLYFLLLCGAGLRGGNLETDNAGIRKLGAHISICWIFMTSRPSTRTPKPRFFHKTGPGEHALCRPWTLEPFPCNI
jgi:hypothetical protein